MAQNAGRARLERGALYGGLVAGLGQIPGQIAKQREDDAAKLAAKQRSDELIAFERAKEGRAVGQETRDAAASKRTQQDAADFHEALGAYVSADPANPQARLAAGIAKAQQLGNTGVIKQLYDFHDLVTKPTQLDTTKDTYVGGVLTKPGVVKPVPPTVASLDAEQQRILAKPAAMRTPDEVASAAAYTARRAPVPSPPTLGSPADAVTRYAKENGLDPTTMTTAQVNAALKQHMDATQKTPIAPPGTDPALPASKAEIAMANYMVPTPSPRSFATPAGKAMMDRILTVNPSFDASLYSVRAPTRKAFTTGTQGQQLTAMNTAIEHLDQLQKAADALDNGSFTPGNAAYNYLKQTFGSNAPTNYDTIKNMVDKEVEAVANKGVPTVSGTAEQKALAGKPASAAQIKGYIDTLIPLMGSKVNALHFQYKTAMGANDPFEPLTPEAAAILTKRGFDPNAAPGARPGAGTDTAAVTAPKKGDVKAITLPSGAAGESTFNGTIWVRSK